MNRYVVGAISFAAVVALIDAVADAPRKPVVPVPVPAVSTVSVPAVIAGDVTAASVMPLPSTKPAAPVRKHRKLHRVARKVPPEPCFALPWAPC